VERNNEPAIKGIDLSIGVGGNRASITGLKGAQGSSGKESGRCCRICLDEEEDLQNYNPFITPCKCTGSMKHIHLNCLREWTDSKKQQ